MDSYPGLAGPALVIQHTGQVFPLTQAPVTIGRQADNAMILSDPQVSRHHATVLRQAGTYLVQDLNSANGTFVNERRITGSEPLRHGDTLRLGNTVIEVHLAPPAHATQPVAAFPAVEGRTSSLLPILLGLLVAGILIACLTIGALLLLGRLREKPSVTIQSPLPGAQIPVGTEITLTALAEGVPNITLLDLRVDDIVVASSPSPDPKGLASLTISKPWTFGQAGSHLISAVAYTARGAASDPVVVEVMAVAVTGTVTPTATPAETVPAPTPVIASPTLPAPTVPVPTETATATPSPTSTPQPSPTPSPTPTRPPAPRIEYFRATPNTIVAGACAKLEWGTVSNATSAVIDHGIGGVGTPGNTPVCPAETTTYVMTATGAAGTTTASATVTVSALRPNLKVESIAFEPSPPVRGQPTQVRIAIRNAGTAPAGAFAWEWLAGSGTRFEGRLDGLSAGDTTAVTVSWTPTDVNDNLATVARVDIDDEVAEADESDNALQVYVQVVESVAGDLELQEISLRPDNEVVLRVSNPGGGIQAAAFEYDLYQDGTLVVSGSDTTPAIGSKVTRTGYLVTGEHTIRAVIDPDGRIDESNEDNNELTRVCSSATLLCSLP